MASLDGKTVLVTGAARGLGEATAKALANAGAAVAVSGRSLAACEAVAAAITDAGGEAMAVVCDVSDAGTTAAAITRVTERYGALDVLVNNAGIIDPIGHIADCDPDAWAANITTNLAGAFHAIHAALAPMLSGGGGRIINVSSGAAVRPLEGWSAYCAGKAGLAMLTRSVDLEYRERGIFCFGFAPGVVDTGMQVKIRASGINPVSQLPRESLAAAADPARAIVWLASGAGDDLAAQEIDARDNALRARIGLEAV